MQMLNPCISAIHHGSLQVGAQGMCSVPAHHAANLARGHLGLKTPARLAVWSRACALVHTAVGF